LRVKVEPVEVKDAYVYSPIGKRDPKSNPPDKYAVLADATEWATNVGYPGYCSAAIDQAFKSWVIPTMFATVAQGKATPEDAAKTAEAEYKRIFERFK
jgi:multiple sugar transport system substrate-binding protein